jgi:hypothetical protein
MDKSVQVKDGTAVHLNLSTSNFKNSLQSVANFVTLVKR